MQYPLSQAEILLYKKDPQRNQSRPCLHLSHACSTVLHRLFPTLQQRSQGILHDAHPMSREIVLCTFTTYGARVHTLANDECSSICRIRNKATLQNGMAKAKAKAKAKVAGCPNSNNLGGRPHLDDLYRPLWIASTESITRVEGFRFADIFSLVLSVPVTSSTRCSRWKDMT